MTMEQRDQALESALQRVAKSEQSSRRMTIVATLIPIGVGLAFLAFTYSQVSDLQAQKQTLNTQVQELDAQVETLRGEDRDLQLEIDEKQRELQKLQEEVALLEPLAGEALGRRSERIKGASSEILAGARAATEASLLAGNADETTRRSQLTITQYAKSLEREVNLAVVVRSLEKFGFRIESKTSKLPIKTNAIWFGADVENDDVRLVALTLMGAGVEIRWISRFNDSEGRKRAKIEIGSWTKVTELEPWTTRDVVKITELANVGNPANPGLRP